MHRIPSFLAVLLLALLPLGAGAADPPAATFQLERTVPLTPNGRLQVDASAGPIQVSQILFRQVPHEKDIPDADPDETCRVHPTLVLTNRAAALALVDATLTLEDEAGKVYMTAGKTSRVNGGASNEIVDAGMSGQRIRILDWPKVKVVRLVVRVETKG